MAIFNSYVTNYQGVPPMSNFSPKNPQMKSQGPGFEVSAVFSAQASPVTSQVEVVQLQKSSRS